MPSENQLARIRISVSDGCDDIEWPAEFGVVRRLIASLTHRHTHPWFRRPACARSKYHTSETEEEDVVTPEHYKRA